MPPLETDCRFQKAVLWAATGFGADGEPTISSATGVEIDVRWEESQDEIVDPQGNTIAIDAKVVVNSEIAVGSTIWLGALEDIASPPVNLKRVVSKTNIPDIKNRENRRVLLVSRASNTLPDVV